MLISASFGTVNTGSSVYYTILNEDKSIYQARTNVGVTELATGSGTYGVSVPTSALAGRSVVWDINGTSKTACESFYDLTNLDAQVSSRLSSASYTVPDNATISTINAKTSQLTFTGGKVDANADVNVEFPSDYLKVTDYTAPDNIGISDIKSKTSQLVFENNKVNANAVATVDEQAIADAVVAAMPPVQDGMIITQDTVGTDGNPIGRIMPFGTIAVYLSSNLTKAQYQFDADADGDFSYKLPYGSVWTLIARLNGYKYATAEVSTVVEA